MNIFSIAITLFLIANPIGNFPAIIALINDFDYETQKKIMIRESFLSLIIALFFQYAGEIFLGSLGIEKYALQMAGGILLLIVSLNMIFPRQSVGTTKTEKKIPMIVPIATPLISGPALMTIIMLYSAQEANNLKITAAILIAWIGIAAALISAPMIQRVLHKKGLAALETLMGLVLALMAVEMLVLSSTKFLNIFFILKEGFS